MLLDTQSSLENSGFDHLPSVSPRIQTPVPNGVYENTENIYEDISTSKKKGKTDGGKKRKGPPKSKD